MNASTASQLPPESATQNATGNQFPPSMLNSFRIGKVIDRLTWLLQPGNPNADPYDFYSHCLSLSRGIDYALANGETPARVHDLPMLLKQIFQQKNDELLQAALMVLMISIKSACEIGWFQKKESEELITIANQIGKVYSSMGSIMNGGPSSCHSAISIIMEKFYPKMKLGNVLASVEAKPGYGALTVDFHITKSKVLKDKICLLVAQIDNTETSACLISPQHVNFLLNGKGVIYRTNVQMDPGPQLPTNVTAMLKFGTNLLQAVGEFKGHYVIMIAYMSVVTSLPEHQVLLDYSQPAVASVDSDSDIIEGPSQISLNCPISFTRIKIPVKGHSCKHFQCFDFDNFVHMNSKRPSWRCPHCNQYVCYADIRLDRNMVEILKNVGENITDVIVLGDGSWKAVLEKDHDVDKMQNKAHNSEKEQTEPQEACSLNPDSNIFDLTKDDDKLETMDTCQMTDKKPFQPAVLSQFVTPISTSPSMNSTDINQNSVTQMDDFWSGVHAVRGRVDTALIGVSEHSVLPNNVSPASYQESVGHENNPTFNSAINNQFSGPNNLQMLNYMNSVNEYGRSSSVPRHINRTPVAVQALPVQLHALGPQQNSITSLNNSLLPSSSSAATHIPLSSPASVDTLNAILSDTERQQLFSRSPVNLPQVSGVNSPAFHHPATQNRVSPVTTSAPTQSHNSYRPRGPLNELSNSHLQQALNGISLPSLLSRSSNTQRSHIQQIGSQSGIFQAPVATANSQQARVMAAPQSARQGSSQARVVQTPGTTAHSHQVRAMGPPPPQAARQLPPVSVGATSFAAGVQRGNTVRSVSRPDELFSSQSEKNWLPTSRMRGSLDLRQHLDDSITQRIITPTQPVQNSRPEGSQPVRPTGLSKLDVLVANNRNAHNSSGR